MNNQSRFRAIMSSVLAIAVAIGMAFTAYNIGIEHWERRKKRAVVRAFAAEAAANGVTLPAHAPADLPLIDVDPVRIREVLTNLVSNALRHTPTGGRRSCDSQ